MLEPAAFWDSSALVPLCVAEERSPQAELWFGQFQIVIWWATPVEMNGALCRVKRDGFISGTEYNKAKTRLSAIESVSLVVLPSPALQLQARSLLERFQLRAADSLQLAAALAWCDTSPKGNVFLSFDQRLRGAAETLGFMAL